MKSIFTTVIKICCVVVFVTIGSVVQAEMITKFEADYSVLDSGEVSVVETINYDFGANERHGIFRTIINTHPQPASSWYKNRTIELEVLGVTRDGKVEPYTVNNGSGESEIKIGDPDATLMGLQTYVITYSLRGALSYGEAGAEFYYNVTGNDWEVPIALAVARVSGELLMGRYYCYQGASGATDTCTNSMKDNGIVTFTANNINPGEQFTVATELDATKVAYALQEEVTWLLFGYTLAGMWLIGLASYVYRFRYAHYVPKSVVAQYEPYQDFLPMYTGYLFDNILDPKDITAGILYLAEQGFIKITRTEKKVLLIFPTTDYVLTLQKPLSEIPSKFLTKVSELLFVDGAAVGTEVPISTLANERAKNAERIMYLKRDLGEDLKLNGFLESTFPLLSAKIPPVLIGLFVVFGGFVFAPNGIILIVLMFAVTIVLGLILLIPRKTASWYEARNHIEGFKLFLSVTDKERFDFHNAPEKSPELFMQYLPYAVALGVEEKWAKVFEGITIPQPDWYEGGNIAAFSTGTLTSDLGAFSTALSTNSGVSGSSGGGSSGGGGGGGGGGSW
ncbi:DUF2207 domain-containing protein [Patescibacteria group bacterium]|nr:DUF2207 domain-containing protein [Patescibacteria group bacterium]